MLLTNLLLQPSLVALALLALAVTEQQEAESVEALRDAVKDLQLQLTVSHLCVRVKCQHAVLL